MDVEYYGPNPQMQGWYLAALRSASALARHLGDVEFAERCDELRARGSRWMDEHLFNGDYYEQQIRPARPEDIRAGLRSDMGAADSTRPTLQLGPGCLVDQLVGEWMARLCGLEGLHDPDKVRRTLEGMIDEGLRVFRDIRARYDGERRSPFDEAECGHHYVRAMASWGGLLAWTGFHYDAVEAALSMKQADELVCWFWSNGSAWGTITQRPEPSGGISVSLEVCEGTLRLQRLRVGDRELVLEGPRTLVPGEPLEASLAAES